MHVEAGTLIDDRYEIQKAIGTGNMGSVFLARQTTIERLVAVKLMHNCQSSTAEGLGRFEREAKVLSTLHHKNIVQLYSYGIWRSFPYAVMEYLEGTSLENRLATEQGLPFDEAMSIMKQLCQAMEHAHGLGVVHRDLKPSNIMLVPESDGWTIKVVDFGLAKLTTEFGQNVQKLTNTGYSVGTALYMSPEQCLGGELDQRTDIYAAGVVMHECLTGKPPFGVGGEYEVMQAHLVEAPPTVASLRPQVVPEGVQAIVYKALAKRTEDRYQSARQMLDDIELVQRGEGQSITSAFKLLAANVVSPYKAQWNWQKMLVIPAIALVAMVTFIALTLALPDPIFKEVLPKLLWGPTQAAKQEIAANLCVRLHRPLAAYDLLLAASADPVLDHTVKKFELRMQAVKIIEPTEVGMPVAYRRDLYADFWRDLTVDLNLSPHPPRINNVPYTGEGLSQMADMALEIHKKIEAYHYTPGGHFYGIEQRGLTGKLMGLHRYEEARRLEEPLLAQARIDFPKSPNNLGDLARLGTIYWFLAMESKSADARADYLSKAKEVYLEGAAIGKKVHQGYRFSELIEIFGGLACCYYEDGQIEKGDRAMKEAKLCCAKLMQSAEEYKFVTGPSGFETRLQSFLETYKERIEAVNPLAAARIEQL